MATEWFYQSETGAFGPISSKDLMQLAGRNGISLDTEVRKGHSGDWFPARKIKEIRQILEENERDSLKPLFVPEETQDNPVAEPSSIPARSNGNASHSVLAKQSRFAGKQRKLLLMLGVSAVVALIGLGVWFSIDDSVADFHADAFTDLNRLTKEIIAAESVGFTTIDERLDYIKQLRTELSVAEEEATTEKDIVCLAVFRLFQVFYEDYLKYLLLVKANENAYREIVKLENRQALFRMMKSSKNPETRQAGFVTEEQEKYLKQGMLCVTSVKNGRPLNSESNQLFDLIKRQKIRLIKARYSWWISSGLDKRMITLFTKSAKIATELVQRDGDIPDEGEKLVESNKGE